MKTSHRTDCRLLAVSRACIQIQQIIHKTNIPRASFLPGAVSHSFTSHGKPLTRTLVVSVIIGVLTGIYVSAALVGMLGRLFGKKKSSAMMTF